MIKNRQCRIEALESRTLLSAVPGVILHGFDAVVVHEADDVAVTDGPNHGTLDPAPGNTLEYNPADPPLDDSFGLHWSSSGISMGVNVLDLADTAPSIAVDDSYTLPEDGDFVPTMPAEGILANDTINGDNPVLNLIAGVSFGDLLLDDDGSFIYLPDPNYFGPDAFIYDVTTTEGSSNLAIVSFDVTPVNDNPVANPESFVTDEDVVLTGTVLANDTDVDGDTLTAHLVVGPSNGDVVLNADGTFTYTPHRNYNGPDSFSYEARDGNGGVSLVAAVPIDVTPVNDPVDVVDDAYTVVENRTFKVKAVGGILANDSDADGDEMTVMVTVQPGSGRLVMKKDGGFMYRPDRGFVGEDTFSYTVHDGTVESRVVAVHLTVAASNAPTARPNLFEFTGGDVGDLHAVDQARGVLSNDYFVAPGDVLTGDMSATLVDAALHGTVTLLADGSFDYVLTEPFVGVDSFTYFARDEGLGINSDPVLVTLLINADPVPQAVGGDIAAIDEYFSLPSWAFSPTKRPNEPIAEYRSYYDYIQSLYD